VKLATTVRTAALAVALTSVSGIASAANYSFLEGGVLFRDTYGENDAGFRIGGSVALTSPLAAYGEFTSNDNIDQFSTGVLFHQPINSEIDWFAGGGLEYVDIGIDDELGFGLRGGLRWTPLKAFEVTPEIRYFDAVDDGRVSFRVGGTYTFSPPFALTAAVQGGDDDRVEVGLRWNFGR
jgi:hypothetical protein